MQNEEEENFHCANSLKVTWLCGHRTLKIPHPLCAEGSNKDCDRKGRCSTKILVDDIMPGGRRTEKCPSCIPPICESMIFYSYDRQTEESNEIKVVNGKLNIDLTRLWLLHCET